MQRLQQKEYRYWEVKVVPVPSDHEIAQIELDEIALEGWKLVAVDMGKAFFIRRSSAIRATTVYRAHPEVENGFLPQTSNS